MLFDINEVHCPSCNHRNIHKSRAKGWGERLVMAIIFRKPVRCYDCYHRFSVFSFSPVKRRIAFAYGQKNKPAVMSSRAPMTRARVGRIRPALVRFP